jgi:iron-sulfur cluster repair protein YtfE (RIC family)
MNERMNHLLSSASAQVTAMSSSNHNPQAATTTKQKASISQRRKDLFGDCALIEIIHLHDCLRGALNALEKDVTELSQILLEGEKKQTVLNALERRVASRFKVIWSVFKAHSSAEDEFIWPALQSKTKGLVKGSQSYRQDEPAQAQSNAEVVEQVQYEEDHADEERMFSMMDDLLTRFRHSLLRQTLGLSAAAPGAGKNETMEDGESVDYIMKEVQALTKKLSHHLMAHLEKEEQQCMPLVVKHLSKSEIHDLVGKIMGQRSSDMIAQIMTMAVQNLNEADREEMVTYMKQAMAGTFFDRWLSMSGWMDDRKETTKLSGDDGSTRKRGSLAAEKSDDHKRAKAEESTNSDVVTSAAEVQSKAMALLPQAINPAAGVTSQAELEKLIRVIATNPNLTPQQINTTIQGLRDSVWKSNQRLKGKSEAELRHNAISTVYPSSFAVR